MRKGTPERRRRARELREEGFTYAGVAAQLGVEPVSIRRWLRPDSYERELERTAELRLARTSALDAARRDVAAQMRYDAVRPSPQAVLLGRMDAVLDAARALLDRELGAAPALRQSCVDVASVATLLAAALEGQGVDAEDEPALVA